MQNQLPCHTNGKEIFFRYTAKSTALEWSCMNRRTLVCLSFLAVFLFSFIFTLDSVTAVNPIELDQTPLSGSDLSPVSAALSSLPPPPAGPTYSDGQYQYEGLGTSLTTTEYAKGSNLSLQVSDFDYGENRYGQVRLPRGWTGYRLEADVYNLYDQPYFIQGNRENGNFNTIGAAWTAQNNGMGDNTSNPYYGTNWGPTYGYSGNGVQTWVEWWSGWTWDVNSYVVWINPINILRDDPVYAKLTFRVNVNLLAGSSGGRGRMVIYAEIAGIVYRLLLDEHCPNNNQWYQLSISVPYDDLETWTVPGTINVRLGLSFTGTQSAWDYEYWGLQFDDVTLEVRGLVNPNDTTWLDLVMNSTIADTAGYGYGSYSRIGAWANPTEVHKRVVAHWQATNTDARMVGFNYNLTLFITRDATTEQQVGTDGSKFMVRNNSAVYWTTWVYAYQPYFFAEYNLSITRPTSETWIIHKVTDALFTDRTSAVTTTSTHFVLPSSAINDVYGWWNFTFTSTNRITSISTVQPIYYINPRTPNSITLTTNFGTNVGEANLTLYNPDGDVINEEMKVLAGSSVDFATINFNNGSKYVAGLYSLCVSYDNGTTPTQTAAGFLSHEFIIQHSSDLTQESTNLWVSYGPGSFYPRVVYNDTDRLLPPFNVEEATVTGTISGNPVTFYEAGGRYEAQIANDLLIPGNYTLNVNANKVYYDSDSCIINVYVRSDTTISSPESPGLTVPYDETFVVQVNYIDGSSAGITGASISTPGWVSTSVLELGTAGWYNLTVDTTDKTSPGTYQLTIKASMEYYQNQSLVLTIVIREISTSITYDPPGSVPWDEDVVISFDFAVNDPESQHHGNGLSSASVSAQLDGSTIFPGSDYILTDLGSGQYTLTILVSSGEISTIKSYTLVIQVTPADSKYSDASRTITFTIRQLETTIIYDPPLPKPWGEDLVIIFNYYVDDSDSSHNGEGITGVTDITGTTLDGGALLGGQYTLVENGGGQYTLTILYSSGRISSIKSYTLQLYVNSPASEYSDSSRQITFSVRPLIMQITFDPISTTPWGDNVVIVFYYRVSDTASSQHGNGLAGVTSIAGSTLDAVALNPVDYLLIDNGGGQYTLTILYSSGKLDLIKTYDLDLYVNSPDTQHEDASQSTTFTIRTLATQITYDPVIPVPWSEDVVITFYYTVNDPASSQDGNDITGVTAITGSTLDAVALNPGDYSLVEVGGGEYTLTILYSSGRINSIKAYSLFLYVVSPDAQHNDASITFSFSVRQIQTFITYDAVSLTPWAEDIVITFYYVVNDPTSSQHGNGIPGVTSIVGSTLDAVALNLGEYSLVDNGGGQYTLTILYSSGKLDNIQSYTLQLHVVSPDTQHEDATQTINFTVRTLLTSISFDPISQVPYGEDVIITFYFVINDIQSSQDGSGLTGVTSLTGSTLDGTGLDPADYTLVEVGSGEYTLTLLFSSGKINSIKTYTLALHVVSPAAQYNAADRTTTFIVRQLGTKISYDPPLPTPWGQDVIITIYYLVEDTASAQHGNGITGVTSIAGSTLDGTALNPSEYTLVEVGSGEYTLTLLYSSGKLENIKIYNLQLVLLAPSGEYANGNQQVTFTIRALTTQVFFDQPSPTPWGDDVVIIFYYRVSDLASTQHGNGITGVTSITGSTLDAVALDPGDYMLVDNGGGQYTLTILYSSGKLNNIKTYTLSLYVNTPLSQYDDASRSLDFDVRIIDTLVTYTPTPPVPRGTDVIIVFYYTVNDPSSSQHGNGIIGVTSIAGSMLDAVALNPADYTLVENGGGQYTLTILFSSGRISLIKTYSLYLNVHSPDAQHEDASENVGFAIRTIRTAISYDAVGSVAWGSDVVITFYYIVDDSASGEDGNGIAGVTSIAGSTLDGLGLNPADYLLVDDGGGQYTLTILYSSGKIATVKIYSLALHVVAPVSYHENADQTIGFRIRNHNVASNIDPISTIPWQNDGTLILRVNDDDVGTPLPDIDMIAIEIIGPTTLFIDHNNWNTWVINGTANDGIFTVNFTTTGWSLNTHSLTINVYTSSNYEDDSVFTAATIRSLAISFTYESPPVVPWGEDGELNVTYLVSDPVASQNGNPIIGGTISITELSLGVDFAYTDNLDGSYTITIFASFLSAVQTYNFIISISSPAQYANGQLNNVPMTVRYLFSTLTYSQVPTTPYGDMVIVDIEYLILDGQSSNNGAFIPGATITVTGIGGLTILPADYFVTEFATYYRITITKSLAIGSYEIEVDATHASGYYRDASIANPAMSFNIRTVYSEIEKEPVDAAPYGENFTIILIYRVRDDASSQDGNGISGSDDIIITTNGSWPVPTYFIFDAGNGFYYITINSDQTPSPGRYWIRVDLGWMASPPIYEEQWVGVWLTSVDRETRIINTNPPDTNYADFIIVYVNYTDVFSGWGIDNSTTGDYVRIRILHAENDTEISTTYFVETYPGSGSWEELTLYFRVLINASELGAVNVIFSFKIEAVWIGGNTPFYERATKAFSVRTTGTQTLLYSETVTTQPTGDDITIVLHYNTTGGLPITNASGNVGILVSCADIPTWDDSYWYVTLASQPGTNGRYVLIIEGSKNLAVGTYTFNITLTWPTGFLPQYAPYYASAEALVSGRVREIQTTMDWTQSSEVFYSQNLTILAQFQDIDHGYFDVPGVTWTISEPLDYSYYQHANGTWIIEIDTSGLGAGAFSFYLEATKANYLSQIRDIDIQIKFAPIYLTEIDPATSSISEYWGVPINVTVYLEDGLTGTPMITSEIYYKWWTYNYTQMTYTGTPGYYTVTLNTGPVGATATQLFVKANITDYETGLLIYTVSILQINTRLELPPGDITALIIFVDDVVQLNVTFEGWNGTHWYPITGANVIANNVSVYLDTFSPLGPGSYYCQFDTSLWNIRTHTIIVIASSPNSVERQVTFTINVQYKPCEIIVEQPSYSANYNENVTINVFLNNTLGTSAYNPISGHTLYFIWQQIPYALSDNGTAGWYSGSFIANETPSTLALEISIYHDVYGKYGDTSTSVPLTISKAETRLQIIRAYTLVTIDGIDYNVSVPFTDSSWFIPIGDTLVLTFRYEDLATNPLTSTEVLDAYFRFYDYEDFVFDPVSNYWTVHFLFENPADAELTITFRSQFYVEQTIAKSLRVGEIPMELISVQSIPNILYVGTTYNFALYLNDTYHNAGIVGASVDWDRENVPAGALIEIVPDPVHPGYYNVTIVANTPSSGTLTFFATKQNYNLLNEISNYVNLQFTDLMNTLIITGSFGAVIMVIALIGWILWARVYSIPWQVRRMRKLAKTVEKDEGYSLSKKDLKRFHARESTMETMVTAAMSTIGVAATKAMIPTTGEVEEITATEEDIITELDKIPGLGAEEKTVLAEEMRKIPRKDRIWFLDDLRRQMGQRRMDFLTQREEPVTPTPTPPVETPPTKTPPAKAPPAEPTAPPIEEVKPKEPPPPKVMTEERTAPTVLPPDLQDVPAASRIVIAEIRRELDKIPGLEFEEKAALIDHLQYLSKEERQATYRSLKQNADIEE